MSREDFDCLFDGCLEQIRSAIQVIVGDRPQTTQDVVEQTRRTGWHHHTRWSAADENTRPEFCDWIAEIAYSAARYFSDGFDDSEFKRSVAASEVEMRGRIRRDLSAKPDGTLKDADAEPAASSEEDEVFQAAVRKAWKSWLSGRFKRGTNFHDFFGTCVNTATKDWQKKHGKVSSLPAEDVPGSDPNPEEQVLEDERRREFRECLERLPAEAHFLFMFRHRYGLTDAQLNLLIGEENQRAWYIRNKAKKELEKRLGDRGYPMRYAEELRAVPLPELVSVRLFFHATELTDRYAFHAMLVDPAGCFPGLAHFVSAELRYAGFQSNQELAKWLNSTLQGCYISPLYACRLPEDFSSGDPLFDRAYRQKLLKAGESLALINAWMIVHCAPECFCGEQWKRGTQVWVSEFRNSLTQMLGDRS